MKIWFYINKNINYKSWKIEFSDNDLCTLKLNIKKNKNRILINIHNVYNSSSVNIEANDGPSTISLLSETLKNSGKHLMMGDFNFYHSYGKRPRIKRQHAGAKKLLEMMKKNVFELILSIGIITGKRKNQFNTIDLIFMSDILREIVVHCDTMKELNQSSNHISIITTFQMKIDETSITKRRA